MHSRLALLSLLVLGLASNLPGQTSDSRKTVNLFPPVIRLATSDTLPPVPDSTPPKIIKKDEHGIPVMRIAAVTMVALMVANHNGVFGKNGLGVEQLKDGVWAFITGNKRKR